MDIIAEILMYLLMWMQAIIQKKRMRKMKMMKIMESGVVLLEHQQGKTIVHLENLAEVPHEEVDGKILMILVRVSYFILMNSYS